MQCLLGVLLEPLREQGLDQLRGSPFNCGFLLSIPITDEKADLNVEASRSLLHANESDFGENEILCPRFNQTLQIHSPKSNRLFSLAGHLKKGATDHSTTHPLHSSNAGILNRYSDVESLNPLNTSNKHQIQFNRFSNLDLASLKPQLSQRTRLCPNM